MDYDYSSFLKTPSGPHWKRIGLKRKAGVTVPLFSLYSSESTGIGEFPDLKPLIDWCAGTGLSLIQLLPLNDTGFHFRPYDAQSSFALEPVYLSPGSLKGLSPGPWKEETARLRERFPIRRRLGRVNYKIKKAKLRLLWKIFCRAGEGEGERRAEFEKFVKENGYWIEDYALFKTIKEKRKDSPWEAWEAPLRSREPGALRQFSRQYEKRIRFHGWLAWQLHEQFVEAKVYGASRGVHLIGDLPFLVSRDSADVWAHQNYFKLDLAAGAPPDAYFALGQRWGMPPYRWENIAQDGYEYLIQKLRCAERFYGLFRIDHVVGMFRIWTIAQTEPLENGGLNGKFDPEDEGSWDAHGRRLLEVILKQTSMLPCAEDLGVVPDSCFRALEDFGIPGTDVQRWMKNRGEDFTFKPPAQYRKNAMAILSNHDMPCFLGWWRYEAGTVDEELFKRQCVKYGLDFEALRAPLFDLEHSRHGRLRWREEIQNAEALLAIVGARSPRPLPGGVLAKGGETPPLLEHQIPDIVEAFRYALREKDKFAVYLMGSDLKGSDPMKTHGSAPTLVQKALEKINQTASIFSIQLLTDWLSLAPHVVRDCGQDSYPLGYSRPDNVIIGAPLGALDPSFQGDPWEWRINFPGTMNDRNWSLLAPFSLEEMLTLPVNSLIRALNEQSDRI